MRVIWEAADIKPGMRVGRPGCTEIWMVGWIQADIPRTEHTYCLVSLADGAIRPYGSKHKLAFSLNEGNLLPASSLP